MFGRKKQQPAPNIGRRSEQLDLSSHKKLQQMIVQDKIEEENVSENDKDDQMYIEYTDDDDPFGDMMKESEKRQHRMTREVITDNYFNDRGQGS